MRCMKTMSLRCSPLLLLAIAFTVHGVEPLALTLHSPVTTSGVGHNFGASVACTEKHVLAGNPEDDELADSGGAVEVFDAKTGKRLRTLRPNDAEVGARFGAAVAISGNYALIGAPMDDADVGSAYVFDVTNGKQLMKILPAVPEALSLFGAAVDLEGTLAAVAAPADDTPGGLPKVNGGEVTLLRLDFKAKTATKLFNGAVTETAANDLFGTSLALSGPRLLVGAPGRASQQGAAYLLNAESGFEVDKWVATDGAAGDQFGFVVDLSGGRGVVGAPADKVPSLELGSAYEFEMKTGNLINKLTEPAGSSMNRFGGSVAIHQGNVWVGAIKGDDYTPNSGKVYLFVNGALQTTLAPLNLAFEDAFGSALAVAGNTLVVGAPNTAALAGHAQGSAFLWPAATLQMSGVMEVLYAQKKESVPGVANATYSSFSKIQMRAGRKALIQANLTGSGAPAGRNVGLLVEDGSWGLWLRTGDTVGPLKVTSISNAVDLYGDSVLAQIKGTGTGINSSNDYAVINLDNSTPSILFREGDELTTGGFSGQKIGAMGPVLGNNEISHGMFYTTLKSGSSTVNSGNDSCVLAFDVDPLSIVARLIEGTATPLMGVNFGQVSSRLAANDSNIHVTTALVATTPGMVTSGNNFALWRRSSFSPTPTLIVRKGAVAAGGTISGFLGEATSYGNAIYRCSLAGVSSTQNEAIFNDSSFTLLCQEGTANAGLPTGVTVSQFIRYFAIDSGALMLVKLRGTGVTAANDLAVLHCQSPTAWEVLLREGDTAPDTGGAKVGVIQQLDAESEGQGYAVVVSLTGSLATTNQALYMGSFEPNFPVGDEVRRHPRLLLRKGAYQSVLGKTVSVTSIKLPVITETSGAGCRGLGVTLFGEEVMAQLTMSDGSVLVGKLK